MGGGGVGNFGHRTLKTKLDWTFLETFLSVVSVVYGTTKLMFRSSSRNVQLPTSLTPDSISPEP